MKYQEVTSENVDEVTEYSVELALQIDELVKERQQLSEILTAFLMSTGLDTYETPNERQLKLYPTLSRSLSSLNLFEKKALFDWAHAKFPEVLVVNHSKLQHLLAYGAIPPIPITAKGFSLRIVKEKQNKKVRKIDEIVIKEPVKEDEVPAYLQYTNPKTKIESKLLSEEEKTLQKKATHEERLERLVDMQSMWDQGETFRAIAKKYGMNSGYVKKMLTPYIRSRMNEMRKAISVQQQKGDTMFSIEI